MNCSDISVFAPLHLAGELDPARAKAFSAHLLICPACDRELRRQAHLDELLRAGMLAEPVDSSFIEARVRESIRFEAHTPQGSSRTRMYAAAGIAAVMLLAFAGYRMLFSPGVKSIYAAAARDHRLEIIDRQPRNWFTDRASIEDVAEREGVSGPVLAALAPAGYRLAQGKLCRLDGRFFLHLVYLNDAGNFSVFLSPGGSTEMDAAIHADSFDGDHVAGFQHGRLSALIVSEQSSATVMHLANFAAAVL